MADQKDNKKAGEVKSVKGGDIDAFFVPRSIKGAAEKGVEAFRVIFNDVKKGASRDMDFIRKNKNKGGINNFRLGCMFLKAGNIRNAKFRFWLASQFAPKSGICYFYMARAALLEGGVKKALMYLKMALYFKPALKIRARNFVKIASLSYPDMLSSLSIFNTGKEDLPKRMARRIDDVGKQKQTLFQKVFGFLTHFLTFVDNAGSFIRSVFITGKRRKKKLDPASVEALPKGPSSRGEKEIDDLIPKNKVSQKQGPNS